MKFKSKKQKEQSSEKSNDNDEQNDLKFIDKRTKSCPLKKSDENSTKEIQKEFNDKETTKKLPKKNLQKNVAVVNFTPNDSSRSISYTT